MSSVLPQMTTLEARRLMAVVQDLSFGQGGFAPGGNSVEQALGEQSDGAMLFVVNYGAGPWVYALDPDGSPKKAFSFNAHIDPIIANFVLHDDDRIYSVEQTRDDPEELNPLPTVHRNNADGSVDKTFAITPLPLPGSYQGNARVSFYGSELAVDSQGRALVSNSAQYLKPNGGTDVLQFTIDRLLPDGGRDPSFGVGGRAVTVSVRFQGYGFLKTYLGPDDKPVVLTSMPGSPVTLTRFTTSGALDTAFGTNGVVTIPSVVGQSLGVAFDSAGRMLVGYSPVNKPSRVDVRRFNTAGQIDTTFGAAGVAAVTDTAFRDGVAFLAVDPMGRIVGGSARTIFRLKSDGTPDATFGGDATIATGVGYLYHTAVTDDAIYAYSGNEADGYGFSRYIDTLTATYDPANRLLKVVGSPEKDTISVTPISNGVRVKINGLATQEFTDVDRVVVDALDGNDVVNASVDLNVSVNLGNGRDYLSGTAGVFNVTGGAGNDTIVTADADDIIETNAGDDSVLAGLGRDHVRNASGSDYVDLGAGGGVFTYGDRNNDDNLPQTVVGRGGVRSRYSVLLGQGSDVVSIVGGAINVDAGRGTANRVTALARVAAHVVTAGENETIVTGEGDDTIINYVRRARISTAGGNDTIQSAYGRDTINCGDGNDTVLDEGGANRIYAGGGDDSIRTGAGSDTVHGGDGSDTIRSGNGDDNIEGGAGRDLIFGSNGSDLIQGGGNNDRLYGGAGADVLYGNAGDDVIKDQDDASDLFDDVDGGAGVDQAQLDDEDSAVGVESVVRAMS